MGQCRQPGIGIEGMRIDAGNPDIGFGRLVEFLLQNTGRCDPVSQINPFGCQFRRLGKGLFNDIVSTMQGDALEYFGLGLFDVATRPVIMHSRVDQFANTRPVRGIRRQCRAKNRTRQHQRNTTTNSQFLYCHCSCPTVKSTKLSRIIQS